MHLSIYKQNNKSLLVGFFLLPGAESGETHCTHTVHFPFRMAACAMGYRRPQRAAPYRRAAASELYIFFRRWAASNNAHAHRSPKRSPRQPRGRHALVVWRDRGDTSGAIKINPQVISLDVTAVTLVTNVHKATRKTVLEGLPEYEHP
jgi:hypothetical protein